jgi:hypothetical protein
MLDDIVNHPTHYTIGKSMEVIDIIESSVEHISDIRKAPSVANVIKYLLRHEHKGTPIDDINKAMWYLKRIKKIIEEDS